MAIGQTEKIQLLANRKYKKEAKQLQKDADNVNMKPIWEYAKKIRMRNKNKTAR